MIECPCACHGGPGAYPPPCDVPGGCGPHDDDTPEPACAAEGCRALPDPVLCDGHARQAGDWLADLGTLYDRLDARPSMQGREPGTGSGGGMKAQRSVGDETVMSLRDPRTPLDHDTRQASVLATLHGWAEQVRDERHLTPATAEFRVRRDDRHIGPHCDTVCDHGSCAALTFVIAYRVPPTVASERKLLADQLPWVLRQDWAGDFYAELRLVARLLEAAGGVGPAIPRPRRACPDCGGTVTVTLGAAACGSCERTWEGLAMAQIGAAA